MQICVYFKVELWTYFLEANQNIDTDAYIHT